MRRNQVSSRWFVFLAPAISSDASYRPVTRLENYRPQLRFVAWLFFSSVNDICGRRESPREFFVCTPLQRRRATVHSAVRLNFPPFHLTDSGSTVNFQLFFKVWGEKIYIYLVKLKLWLSIILFWLEKKAPNTGVFPRRPVAFETHEKWQQAQFSPSEVSRCLIFTYFL